MSRQWRLRAQSSVQGLGNGDGRAASARENFSLPIGTTSINTPEGMELTIVHHLALHGRLPEYVLSIDITCIAMLAVNSRRRANDHVDSDAGELY